MKICFITWSIKWIFKGVLKRIFFSTKLSDKFTDSFSSVKAWHFQRWILKWFGIEWDFFFSFFRQMKYFWIVVSWQPLSDCPSAFIKKMKNLFDSIVFELEHVPISCIHELKRIQEYLECSQFRFENRLKESASCIVFFDIFSLAWRFCLPWHVGTDELF